MSIGLSMTPAALSLADRQDKSRTGSNATITIMVSRSISRTIDISRIIDII